MQTGSVIREHLFRRDLFRIKAALPLLVAVTAGSDVERHVIANCRLPIADLLAAFGCKVFPNELAIGNQQLAIYGAILIRILVFVPSDAIVAVVFSFLSTTLFDVSRIVLYGFSSFWYHASTSLNESEVSR